MFTRYAYRLKGSKLGIEWYGSYRVEELLFTVQKKSLLIYLLPVGQTDTCITKKTTQKPLAKHQPTNQRISLHYYIPRGTRSMVIRDTTCLFLPPRRPGA